MLSASYCELEANFKDFYSIQVIHLSNYRFLRLSTMKRKILHRFDSDNEALPKPVKRKRANSGGSVSSISSSSSEDESFLTDWCGRRKRIKTSGGSRRRCSKIPCPDPASTISADFHQRSACMSEHKGTQCTSMSVASILASTLRLVDLWNSDDMNRILKFGDRLHKTFLTELGRSIDGEKKITLKEVPALPSYSVRFYNPFQNGISSDIRNASFTKTAEIYGKLGTVSDLEHEILGFSSLEDALAKTLYTEQCTGAAITIGNASGAVFRDINDHLRYFDSHCMDKHGQLTLDGTAVLLSFDCIQDFVSYVCRRERSDQTMYDMVGISADVSDKNIG